MRSIFFKQSSPSTFTPPSSPRYTFTDSLVDENVETAMIFIEKWDHDIETGSFLFQFHRQEAKEYISAVYNLQSAMHHYIKENSNTPKLVQAQSLMQKAMKLLEKEFHHILKTKRENPDSESVSTSRTSKSSFSDFDSEDESSRHASESVHPESDRIATKAMDDLKLIADCMIASGYTIECINTYKVIRKSVLDEAMYNLGIERFTLAQVQKMDWEVLEYKIKQWLNAVKIAVKKLFYSERLFCEHVFSASASIREACFTEISKEGAMFLFGFPENVAKCKVSPEKMFRILDMYEAISNLWVEIEAVFTFQSVSEVKLQAVTSLSKLGDAVRAMLTEFDAAIQKDNSKTTVPGGGIHPLTRYVMNYLTFLSDYASSLVDIVEDWPLQLPSPLPEAYNGYQLNDEDNVLAVRFAWLVLVLVCKIDSKAELYKDVALSYLFLANNLQYVIDKVRCSNLKFAFGDDWMIKYEMKVKQYASNYERLGWGKVFASLPGDPTVEISSEQASDCFKRFNLAFEDVCKKQSSWIVSDPKLRDEIKVSLANRIVPAYTALYEKYRAELTRNLGREHVVKFAPDDLGNYLSDLFYGGGVGPGPSRK
ncbi:hypothetical protein ACFE04_014133 [Oxalis oulophora]